MVIIRPTLLLITIPCWSLFSINAYADPVTLHFVGTVTLEEGDTFQNLIRPPQVGDIFHGSVTYDPSIPPAFVIAGDSARFEMQGAPLGMRLALIGPTTLIGTNLSIGLVHDLGRVVFGSLLINAIVGPRGFLTLQDGRAINITTLPSVNQLLDIFHQGTASFDFDDSNGIFSGTINSLTRAETVAPTPEPATFALMAVAIGIVLLRFTRVIVCGTK
jgi:hypothetical protein